MNLSTKTVKLQKQIEEVLKYNSVLPISTTDYFNCYEIVEKWRINKTKLNKYLHLNEENNWIYNCGNVTLHLTDKEKEKVFTQYIDHMVDLMVDLKVSFEDWKSIKQLFDFLQNSVKPQEFFNNQLEETYDTPRLIKGTKLIKDFKYFIDDPEILEIFQQKASDFIQKDRITGELCVSTNPLDFLSVSENTLHWRSCHNLKGLFCGGGLSYMVDPSSVVVYIKTNQDVILPHFPKNILWNNKKWRMMLHFSNGLDLVYGGRPYPYYSQAALDAVSTYILGLHTSDNWSDFHTGANYLSTLLKNNFGPRDPINTCDYRKFINCGFKLIMPARTIHESENALNYDDLRESSYPEQLSYAWNSDLFYNEYGQRNYEPSFHVGEDVPCPRCSKKVISPLFAKGFACIDCAINAMTGGYCEKCGAPIDEDNVVVCNSSYYDDGSKVIEDRFLCPACAAEEDMEEEEGYDS